MSDVVCIGIGCVDVLVVDADLHTAFAQEAKNCREVSLTIGGDAINQAVVLTQLGASTKLITGVGSDPAGELILSSLERYGVPAHQVQRAQGNTRVNVIVVDSDGQRHFIHEGKPASASLFVPELRALEKCSVVSLCSLLAPPFLTPESILRVARHAHELGAVVCADVMCNAGVFPLAALAPALSYLDYFFPNYEEAALLTGKRDLQEIADALLACGIGAVVIKTGKNGCFVKNAQGSFEVPAVQVEVVDTTGAGDSFAAGFIYALLRQAPLSRCCECACACAAAAVQRVGATAVSTDFTQVQKLL